MIEHRIVFRLEDEERKVVVATDNEWMTLGEMFMLWVDFVSACGYVVDKVDMQHVWDDITTPKPIESNDDNSNLATKRDLAKAIQALEGVEEYVEEVAPYVEDQAVLSPKLATAVAVLDELKR